MSKLSGQPFPLARADLSPYLEGKASRGKEMLRSLIESEVKYERREKELGEMLERISRSGIDVRPLKKAIWNYIINCI